MLFCVGADVLCVMFVVVLFRVIEFVVCMFRLLLFLLYIDLGCWLLL